MTPVRTDLPAVGTVWRDRWAPKRTVKVIGASGEADDPGRLVISETLTDDTGESPTSLHTNHSPLKEWDWMYEPAGLGARTGTGPW